MDDEIRSNASSSIFDREFLGPLPWEKIHKLEDEYFKSKVLRIFSLVLFLLFRTLIATISFYIDGYNLI